jgi:hypothetical protein
MNTSRRQFLQSAAAALAATSAAVRGSRVLRAQEAGARPPATPGVAVLLPRGRVPVSWIIDDSTCLVNLNRFAIPQFAAAWGPTGPYRHAWRDWPVEIPDAFVRKFGEWCAAQGVKGKYSIVPFPACVGRLDRELPGWTQRELKESLDVVREVMRPHWDIHPEMVTHTRVIDLATGHPHPEISLRLMENWDWTTGRSADEIAHYMAYALQILKNVGLPCEGITTPGGFGNRALPQLAQASLEAVRSVFGAEIPHYFRHAFDQGPESVAPRVEYARGLESADPRCVVSLIACTGDWTGGWDNSPPEGPDRFISPDLQTGRVVEIIERGEPALLLSHWTGIYWNGRELGFRVLQEVVRRLHARYDHLVWMKLSEIARYWAARELTRIERMAEGYRLQAPFACPDFTLRLPWDPPRLPRFVRQDQPPIAWSEVAQARQLRAGTWWREGGNVTLCFDLPPGRSEIQG